MILILHRLSVERAVGDLHDGDRRSLRHIARARRVHEEEVRILLAAEVDGAHDQAESLFRPALRQLGRHEGNRQLPRLEEVEARDAFACGHSLAVRFGVSTTALFTDGVRSVDGDQLAGDVGRTVTGEEGDHVRDLLRGSGAPERGCRAHGALMV